MPSSQNRNTQKPLRHLNSVCSDLGIMLLKNSFSHKLACWVKNDQREMVMLVSEMALRGKTGPGSSVLGSDVRLGFAA